jgi:hypothetical protein
MVIRKLVEILRVYIISPEMLVIALSFAAVLLYPEQVALWGMEVSREDSKLQYIALIPVALLGVAYTLSKDILKPLDGMTNRILYEWDNYWQLKYRTLAALFFCLSSAVSAIGLWVFKTRVPSELLGVGLTCTIMLALVSTVSLYLGYLRLREILQGGS